MSQEVRNDKEQIIKKYEHIMNLYSNPFNLSLALERDEANIPIIRGPWIWDVVVKYFPLVNQGNWKDYAEIVKKAVKICVERGVQIGIVPMKGKLTKTEKKWTENGFWWRVQKFPRIGRLTKNDAKMLQLHRYNVIGGITKGGVNILKAAGYSDEESKSLFYKGSMEHLSSNSLLPQSIIPKQKKIGYKR